MRSWSNINVFASFPNAGASFGHPYQGPAVGVPEISLLLATSWEDWDGGFVEILLSYWSPSLAAELSFDLSLTLRPFLPTSVTEHIPTEDPAYDGFAVRFD